MRRIPRLLVLPILLTLGVLAAPSVRAGEEGASRNAEDRYHDAYVAEVIEGDLKAAAEGYLALIEEDRTPSDIRAEARLRFAIVVTLLGRADEARLRLTGLVADPEVPAAVKERARTVLASIADVGAGSALDRKLQDLVFDLARVNPWDQEPSVYRDFEVLGARAVPFLRGLLQHEDRELAQHAFRLLVRMGEPGMGRLWTPRAGGMNVNLWREWMDYLAKRPEEARAWEEALLARDDAEVERQLGSAASRGNWWPPYPPFSAGFLQALAGRPALRPLALHFLVGVPDEAAKWKLVDRWLASEDEDLASGAATWVMQHSQGGPADEHARWPKVFPWIVASGQGVSPNTAPEGSYSGNLLAWLRRLPSGTLLDALDTLLNAQDGTATGPLTNGLASSVARVLGERDLEGDAMGRYADALRRWLDAWAAGMGAAESPRTRYAWVETTPLLAEHVRDWLEKAHPGDAETFLAEMLRGPARGHLQLDDLREAFRVVSVADLDRLMLALPMAAPGDRPALVDALRGVSGEELRHEVLRRLPAIVKLVAPETAEPLVGKVPEMSQGLSATETRAVTRALLEAIHDASAGSRNALPSLLHRWVIPRAGREDAALRANYFVNTVLPALDDLWSELPKEEREDVLRQVAGPLKWSVGNGPWIDFLMPENRERLYAFLHAHLGELPGSSWGEIVKHPGIAPVPELLAHLPESFVGSLRVERTEADAVARELAVRFRSGIVKPTGTRLVFVRDKASPEVAREVFDALLRSEDPAVRNLAIQKLGPGGRPATTDALQAAQTALLAETDPDIGFALTLARRRMEAGPTAEIFPLIRHLLGTDDKSFLLAAMGFAKDLGQSELVPDLVPFLDSMDKDLRQAARDAIEAIREVARLKNEEALRAAGMLPETGTGGGGR